MDLAEAADRLYAATPDDFMAARTEQVAAAKAAGDKALAKQIGGLRKPTRSAWLVNLVAREAADELAELIDLGGALREAQRKLDGAELRTLSSRRNKAVNALSRRAVELGAAVDYTATEAVRLEVSQSLQAALADPEQAELVRRGVLAQAISYGGFGPFDLAAAAAAPTPGSESAADAEPEPEPEQDAEPDAEPDAEQEAARAAWQQARDDLAAAEHEAERVTAEADELADRLDELRRQLAETEQAEAEARRAARQARKQVDELTIAEQRAERRARELVDG